MNENHDQDSYNSHKISINTRTKITKTKLSKETTITTTTLAPRDIDNINHNRGNST